MESRFAVSTAKNVEELEEELEEKDALIRQLRSEVAELKENLKAREIIDQAKCLLIEAGASEKKLSAA